ncbi:heterokaryon incompatibility protein-domain-containing protein [Rhexocercosporidium sp. MPI-PUGE-AT-0058]|nr:heterokaryon incompatibility protein-domain-containing protein [Rhexocercosporidium sp. MPI-PUGE-AT-0058]
MASDTRTPHYHPLDGSEIRLLVVLPGVKAAPIHCQLVYTGIQNDLSTTIGLDFQALSYMWGPIEPQQSILVDRKEISIRPNLWAALQAIRDTRNTTTVWVDALCINQQDVAERSEHVKWMGDIYRAARKVLVWLGEAGEDSDMLLDYHSEKVVEQRGDINDDKKARLRKGFEALCSRPYWKRVWIIQEVLIARDLQILCGSRQVLWNQLFCYLLQDQTIETPILATYFQLPDYSVQWPPGYRIVRFRGFRGGAVHPLTRLFRLCLYCNSQCEDIRDRIYGLLGVTSDGLEITPDYSKSVSQVYISVFRGCFARGQYFTRTSSLTRDLQKLLGDPLWDQHSESFHRISIIGDEYELENPTRGLFLVRIRLVATVEFVSPVMNESHLKSGFEFQWHNTGNGTFKSWYSILTGARRNQTVPCKFRKLPTRVLHQTQEIGGRYSITSKTKGIPHFECVKGFRQLEKSTGSFRLFATNNNEMGIGACEVRTGDVICRMENMEEFSIIVRPKKRLTGYHDIYLVGRAPFCDAIPTCAALEHPQLPTNFTWNLDLKSLLLLLR